MFLVRVSIAVLGLASLCSAGAIETWIVAQGTCGWGQALGKLNAQQCAELAMNVCENGHFWHSPSYPSWGCGCCTQTPDYAASHRYWRTYAFGEKHAITGARFGNGLSHSAGPVGRCIDGNQGNFCHSKDYPSSPYLRLDLGSRKSVQRVLINNRPDCCTERLGTFEIWVGDDANGATANTRCARHTTSTQNVGYVTATCDSTVAGRYIYVYLPGHNRIINLAEVRAYSYFDDYSVHYAGCYHNGGDNRVEGHVSGKTYDECKYRAFRRAGQYFGLECPHCSAATGDAQCLIVDQNNWVRVDDSECEREVDAAGKRLGGHSRIAVWTHSHNTDTPTAAPTAAPTADPTAAPTTAEFHAEQMTLADLAVHEWTTGTDGNDFYKCHDYRGCYVNRLDSRDSFERADRPVGVDFSPATSYLTQDGFFSVDGDKITFNHVNGADTTSWPYSCACSE